MTNFCVISIIAEDAPGLAEKYSSLTSQHNCNIEDSRMAVMGQVFTASMLISGSENGIANCKADFEQLAKDSNYQLICRDTEENKGAVSSLPYAIQTLSLDAPGIIRSVTDFLKQRDINISNFVANSYKAPHTGAPMLEIQITANIPSVIQISQLRDEFADFCDELHIDAAFEPIKQ